MPSFTSQMPFQESVIGCSWPSLSKAALFLPAPKAKNLHLSNEIKVTCATTAAAAALLLLLLVAPSVAHYSTARRRPAAPQDFKEIRFCTCKK